MQRKLLNAVLFAVAIGLATAVILSQKKDEKGAPVTPFAAADITQIRIAHPGAPDIALEKTQGVWRLTEPVKAEADPFEVNGVLAVAGMESQQSLDPSQVSLKDLGLEPPSYTLTLNDQKLEFGGTEPIQFRRYVRTLGKIELIPDPPSAGLDADYSDLVTRSLLPSDAQIQSIEGPDFSLRRSSDGKHWTLSKDDAQTSSDAKQKCVDAWKNARALWNAAAPKELKGERVVVTTQHGAITFTVTQRSPQLIIARQDLGVSFTLSEELMKQMLELPAPQK